MLKEIGTYLEKPEETEVRYLNNALNKPHGPEPVRVENTMRQTDEPMGATRPR
ncbi:MAG TPA: hypothetical protein VFF11_12130 [Candidatus Binatia bacterium]|nr:hypothetical protein [Candidatus Binatia bacterium]